MALRVLYKNISSLEMFDVFDTLHEDFDELYKRP